MFNVFGSYNVHWYVYVFVFDGIVFSGGCASRPGHGKGFLFADHPEMPVMVAGMPRKRAPL